MGAPFITYDHSYVRRTLSPAVRTNGTVNGAAVDTAEKGGAGWVNIVVVTGTYTDGTHTISVEESADGSTGWTTVAAGAPRTPAGQGTAKASIAAGGDANSQFEWGVQVSLRYLRVSIVTSGATSGAATAAVIVVGPTRIGPAH